MNQTTFTLADIHEVLATDLSLREAHRRLELIAADLGYRVHLHKGSWAGTALSTVYPPTGDPFLNAVAVVRVTRRCTRCGDVLPLGQSCGCFDNNCQ